MAAAYAALAALLLPAARAALPDEWRNRSIYQLLTDRFARSGGDVSPCDNLGTFCGGKWAGITAHLDYIQALGFDAVWISPPVDNADNGYHGYWQRDMYAANAYFGSAADLQALSAELHARGMYLMLDVVGNHASMDQNVSINYPFDQPGDYHACTPGVCGGFDGCQVDSSTDLLNMEECRFAQLMDFNQTVVNGSVSLRLQAWAASLVANYSADGLRVDTVPYVRPEFWRAFEAASGVWNMGEVGTSDVNFAAGYQGAALSGILSYPLFFVLRNVFASQQSMRQLGDAWRAGMAAWKDLGLLGTFLDNHDNVRFRNVTADWALYRAGLGYAMLSDGIPIVYYGSEWGFSGGHDPFCREPFWMAAGTGSYNATAAPLGSFLAALNAYRRQARLWESPQIERWQDETYYAFSKGNTTLVVTTNVGSGGSDQTRAVTYLPQAWGKGTRLCNALDCRQCATVTGGALHATVSAAAGVAIYDPAVAPCASV